MPANRSKLHVSKVDEFARWAVTVGYTREETRGDYEALRLADGSGSPVTFYQRTGTEHLTVPFGLADRLVDKWLRTRNDTA